MLGANHKKSQPERARLSGWTFHCRVTLTSIQSYFETFWQKRVRITATCARVALPLGVSVVALVPLTRPSALAQRMASTA